MSTSELVPGPVQPLAPLGAVVHHAARAATPLAEGGRFRHRAVLAAGEGRLHDSRGARVEDRGNKVPAIRREIGPCAALMERGIEARSAFHSSAFSALEPDPLLGHQRR